MKMKARITGIITLLCFICTVALWFATNNQNVEYEEVEATVLSAKDVTRRVKKTTITHHEIKVQYEGETYELENAYDSWSYTRGEQITVYLSNGKLYANVEGVETSTPIAIVYFVFLFLSFVMLIVWLTCRGNYRKMLKGTA